MEALLLPVFSAKFDFLRLFFSFLREANGKIVEHDRFCLFLGPENKERIEKLANVLTNLEYSNFQIVVKNSIENSLKNLKTDYIDLVQLHSCDVHILQKGDVVRALQDAQTEGKTRFIGLSDWSSKKIMKIFKTYFF